jgi:HEAT repeat protein
VPQRGGSRTASDVTAIIANDPSIDVKQRAVKGLAALPGDESVPLLLQLARSSTVPAVRKEAVTALGRSRDPRAIAFMEGLLK